MAIKNRKNEEWLGKLRPAERSPRAVQELRQILRRALDKALGNHADLSHADLDDFAQEAIHLILDRLEAFRDDCRFTTWAIGVAMRAALDRLRQRRDYHPLPETIDLAPLGRRTEDALPFDPENPALLTALRRAFDVDLDDKERELALSEEPLDRVALRQGSNRARVFAERHVARRKLRDSLLEAGFPAPVVAETPDTTPDASEPADVATPETPPS